MEEKIIPIVPETAQAAPRSEVPADGEAAEPQKKAKKSVAVKKLEKRIMRLAGEAVTDFGMIGEGDRIAVAVSGGKDSYVLLETLMKLQRRAPVHFELLAINVDMNMPGFPHDLLPNYFEKIGVPYHIERQDSYATMKRLIPSGENLCSLCSRLRRGILYSAAEKLGITKIALGHQMDDIVSTLLLNMFYSGQIKGMPPVLRSDDGAHVIIRPLAYVRESETLKWAQIQGYPLVPKNLCGAAENRCRAEMKEMLRQWERTDKDRMYNVFKSMSRIAPSHMMDKTLWDFEEFRPLCPEPAPLRPRVRKTPGQIR